MIFVYLILSTKTVQDLISTQVMQRTVTENGEKDTEIPSLATEEKTSTEEADPNSLEMSQINLSTGKGTNLTVPSVVPSVRFMPTQVHLKNSCSFIFYFTPPLRLG